jgi:hypothetical protein
MTPFSTRSGASHRARSQARPSDRFAFQPLEVARCPLGRPINVFAPRFCFAAYRNDALGLRIDEPPLKLMNALVVPTDFAGSVDPCQPPADPLTRFQPSLGFP